MFPVRLDESEFRQLYESSLPVIFGFLLVRTGGDRALSEDLTAEAFTAAAREFQTGRADIVTVSWLRTVARRRLIDHWRREQTAKAARVLDIIPKVSPIDPEDDQIGAVLEAMSHLQPDAQRALILRHVEGYGVREVAEILGRTEKATESLLSRARTSFRSAFEGIPHG